MSFKGVAHDVQVQCRGTIFQAWSSENTVLGYFRHILTMSDENNVKTG